MNKLKTLIAVLFIMIGSSQAQSFWNTNNVAAGFHLISETPIVLQSITAWTTNQSATIIRLIAGYVVSTNAAYTNYTTYATNIVTTYITSLGTTNQMTNAYLHYQATAVAATTNGNPRTVVTFVIPGSAVANQATTPFTWIPPSGSVFFTTRSSLSNNAAGTSALINYRAP